MENRYIVSSDREPILAQQINRVFQKIDERVNELEHKNSKVGKKPDISRAEKSAILYELGVMDHLLTLGFSQKKVAALLSILLNASQSNIEKDLSLRHSHQAPFKTKDTYKNLTKRFKDLKLEDLEQKAQNSLDKLED